MLNQGLEKAAELWKSQYKDFLIITPEAGDSIDVTEVFSLPRVTKASSTWFDLWWLIRH